jgi:membrane protein DedA with SNARE-associated domain
MIVSNGQMDLIQSHLQFLVDHVLGVVFGASLVEAAGIPFPSRILLLVAATVTGQSPMLLALVAVNTLGALIGDHVPYLAGAVTGPRILTVYCRLTLGSERCVEKTVEYFTRFGATAILLSRFSTSVRLFASALSGCGHIPYPKFLVFDLLGTLLYTVVWVAVGYLVGERAADLLSRHGSTRLLVLVGPVALAALVAYRLWRRSRYGPADAAALRAESACVHGPGRTSSSAR